MRHMVRMVEQVEGERTHLETDHVSMVAGAFRQQSQHIMPDPVEMAGEQGTRRTGCEAFHGISYPHR